MVLKNLGCFGNYSIKHDKNFIFCENFIEVRYNFFRGVEKCSLLVFLLNSRGVYGRGVELSSGKVFSQLGECIGEALAVLCVVRKCD